MLVGGERRGVRVVQRCEKLSMSEQEKVMAVDVLSLDLQQDVFRLTAS